MKLKKTVLRRGRHLPFRGSVGEGTDLGPGLVEGPWVIVTVQEAIPINGTLKFEPRQVAIWGDDVAPSEVEVDADPVQRSSEAPARGRARPSGAEGT